MKERIQRITRHTAYLWFDKGRDFYVVPDFTDRLSKGELVDSQVRLRYDTLDEFLDYFKLTHAVTFKNGYTQRCRGTKFYHIY